MTPTTDVLIGAADLHHVLIRPLGRKHPGLFDHQDSTWIECDLDIAAGAFSGRFHADLRSEEFDVFLQEADALSRSLEGAASLTAGDGGIAIAVTGDGNGPLRVRGEAVDVADAGNRLRFDFAIDQACVPDICQSLRYLLAAYPVTGASGA